MGRIASWKTDPTFRQSRISRLTTITTRLCFCPASLSRVSGKDKQSRHFVPWQQRKPNGHAAEDSDDPAAKYFD